VGPVEVGRRYFTCPACGQGDFGADRVLGLEGYLTSAAQGMACLAGVRQSFARAETLLAELSGWELDDETIRRLCHAEAASATARREERATAEAFAAAPGDRELQMDAGKVNTQEGWRDVKVAVFACRERGEPVEAAAWDRRDLPAPSVRSVIAAIEEASLFGERCAAEARRLGLTDASALSVSGDGAEWIWNLSGRHFPGASENLDIHHGAEHVAETARRVLGEGTAEARSEAERGRLRLLEDGYWGVTEWVGLLGARAPAGGDGAALGQVLNYFAGHQGRLNYALRLRRGQSIGSGMIEGSIKQLVNRRIKQTGARWKVAHVGPLVELCALAHSPEWNAHWNR
jgi:ribosomal protein L12E/L44/L45/RPP1/RPP2